jgi:hypothetical protein
MVERSRDEEAELHDRPRDHSTDDMRLRRSSRWEFLNYKALAERCVLLEPLLFPKPASPDMSCSDASHIGLITTIIFAGGFIGSFPAFFNRG